jgi:hypothetical protein
MKTTVAKIAYAIAIILVGASLCQADDRTPEQVKAAKDFMVEGISFTATPQTIRAKWPNIERVAKDSDAKLGLEVLRVDTTLNTDGIDFTFVDGKLMQMLVWYFPDRLNKMGGSETIATRIVAKLGKADADSDGYNVDGAEGQICKFDWVIPDADRFIRLSARKKSTVLIVQDRELKKKLEAKKQASANTGF